MHEAGLCQGVLAVVLDVAQDEPVSRVRVRLGRLQGVLPDHFEFHWQLLAMDSAVEGEKLELVELPGDELVVEEVELTSGEVRRNPRLTEFVEKH